MTVLNPSGLCGCGCKETTPLCSQNRPSLGYAKGDPLRFVPGHQTRKSPVPYLEEDRGYDTPCWIWQRATAQNGRNGSIRRNGRLYLAHRWYYEQAKGPIPEGLDIDHLCEVTLCVNPDHLEAVTHQENVRRASKLSHEDVEFIRTSELRQVDLAAKFSIHPAHVWRVKNSRRWAA